MKFNVKQFFLMLTLGTVFVGNALAYSAEEIVGKKNYEILMAEGKIIHEEYNPKQINLNLLPQTELSNKISNSWTNKYNPVFISENLHIFPKSQLNENPQKINIENASKIIRSVSKMKGMQYKSSSKKTEVLYKQAYCIKSQDDQTSVKDKSEGFGNDVVQYCILDDNSFGTTKYKISYYENSEEVAADFCSVSPIKYGFIKAVEAGNLHTELLVADCDEYVIIYVLVMTKYPAIDILQKRFKESFNSRLDAVCNWFLQKYREE